MQLDKGVLLYEHCQRSRFVRERYDEGDAKRSGQTKHGFVEHAIPVVNESIRLAEIIRQQKPGLIDDWTFRVTLPFGALLHDIGGCLSIEEHDTQGAQLMQDHLKTLTLDGDTETLPLETQKHIVRIIAYHRAGKFIKKSFTDHALDIVLLADKSVGDEARVRPGRAWVLGWLTKFGFAGIPLRNNGAHDRINFAVESSNLVLENGEMILRLKVKDEVLYNSPLMFWLPKRKSIYETIYEHEYYKKNFHAMEIAARNLGYKFYLEFNGKRHAFDKATKTWSEVVEESTKQA